MEYKLISVFYKGEEYFAKVSVEDFDKVQGYKWRCAKRTLVNGKTFLSYPMTSIGYSTIIMHQMILGEVPEGKDVIDHINHDKFDNRRENLRFLTNVENGLNWAQQKYDGFKGVWWNDAKGKFRASYSGKYLGLYNEAEDAALAYDRYLLYLGITTASFYNFSYTPEEKDELRQKPILEEKTRELPRHIHQLPSGHYQVMFRRVAFSVTETYDSLEQALVVRDKYLVEYDKLEKENQPSSDPTTFDRNEEGIAILRLKSGSTDFTVLLDDDVYVEAKQYKWQLTSDLKVQAKINGKNESLHRWIWKKFRNPEIDKTIYIDHINKPTYDSKVMADCRLEFLRETNAGVNNHNKTITSKVGYKGVYPVPKREGWYRGEFRKDGVSYKTVNYKCVHQAALAYNQLVLLVYMDKDEYLNKVPEGIVLQSKELKLATYTGIQIITKKTGGYSFAVKGRKGFEQKTFSSIVDAVSYRDENNDKLSKEKNKVYIKPKTIFWSIHLSKEEKETLPAESIDWTHEVDNQDEDE